MVTSISKVYKKFMKSTFNGIVSQEVLKIISPNLWLSMIWCAPTENQSHGVKSGECGSYPISPGWFDSETSWRTPK